MKPHFLALLLAPPLAALLLTQAVIFQQSTAAGRWLFPLLLLNIAFIVVIVGAAGVAAARFWRRWRRGGGGSRLASRLAGLFLGMALLPSAALYAVSAGGVLRGIESWFDTPLGQAFEEGMIFGQNVLGREFDSLRRDALNLAATIDNGRSLPFWRDDLLLLYRLDDIVIYDYAGSPVASAGGGDAEPLSAPALRNLRRGRTHHSIAEGEGGRTLEVAAPLASRRSGYALKASRALPEVIDAGLSEVDAGRKAYERLLILRRGLLYSFMATLTLSFAMVLAVSIWASVRLGMRIFRPLTRMARAAEAVGRGDFEGRLPESARDDEIGLLSRAFNEMMSDLRRSRAEIGERQAMLSKANEYMTNLLESLSAGVLAVDANGRLARANRRAESMLGAALRPLEGVHYSEWRALPEIAEMVREFEASAAEDGEHRLPGGEGRALVARLRRLPAEAGGGTLVMIDDISRQIEAERRMAWLESSRQFMHEIHNPLTPIQLAADRLQSKLSGKLGSEDEQLLTRLASIITAQVSAMRQMAIEFRRYAEVMSFRMSEVDLNALASEAAQMYENPPLFPEVQADSSLPPVQGDSGKILQALRNLLANASDAAAGRPDPRVVVRTELRSSHAALIVEDNGGGLAPGMAERAFTPYQTTKSKGTGLGLAIVRNIMEGHEGEVLLENANGGARATLLFPLRPKGRSQGDEEGGTPPSGDKPEKE